MFVKRSRRSTGILKKAFETCGPAVTSFLMIITCVTVFLYSFLISKSTFNYNYAFDLYDRSIKTYLGIYNRREHIETYSPKEWIEIYHKQHHHVQTAQFLPTYQNYRLRLKFNRTSLLLNHDHIMNSARYSRNVTHNIHIICIQSDNSRFNFDISFIPNMISISQYYMAWKLSQYDPSIIFVSSFTSDILVIDIRQHFKQNDTFTFSYQWSYSKISKPLCWPIWPLKNDPDSSDFTTCSLKHSNSKQSFLEERKAIQHWIDLQYNATNNSSLLPRRRTIPFELLSNQSVCSKQFISWIDSYVEWHANITTHLSDRLTSVQDHKDFIEKNNIRFLLYETLGSGTADRITHLITTYLISILTNRLFLFDPNWTEFSDIMGTILYDDLKEILPWFSSNSTTVNFPVGIYRFSVERLLTDYDYEKNFTERFVIFRAHTGGIGHMLLSNTSIYRKFLTEDLRMDVSNLFGCLYHSFLVYRLSGLIERTWNDVEPTFGHSGQQLLQTLLSSSIYPIGIQVRMGDEFLKENFTTLSLTSNNFTLGPYARFIDCAQNFAAAHQPFLENSRQTHVALLVSDTLILRQAVLKRWQYPFSCLHSSAHACTNITTELHFLASPDPVLHVAYTNQTTLAFDLAMFDVFLMSLCEQHVITHSSGFGRIGVFAGLKQRNIFSLSYYEYTGCSNMNSSTSLQKCAYQWSGI